MKKRINPISIFKSYKNKIFHETKFYVLTGIIPVFGFCYMFYNIYTYKLYNIWKENIFTINEEKQIAKKIYPVLKYKNIEKIYNENSDEHQYILSIYKKIITYLKFNMKSEVFLIKSDLLFLNILSTGSLFISDVNKFNLFTKYIFI